MRVMVALCLLLVSCEIDPNSAINVPRDVQGVITEVEGDGLEDVDAFTLKSGRATYRVLISDDVEYGFPLGHLRSHQRGAEPVNVRLREEDGRLYAVTIEDVEE